MMPIKSIMLELLDPKRVWLSGSKIKWLSDFVFRVPLVVWFSGVEHPKLYGGQRNCTYLTFLKIGY